MQEDSLIFMERKRDAVAGHVLSSFRSRYTVAGLLSFKPLF